MKNRFCKLSAVAAALLASSAAFAGGLGIYVNDVEVGAGSPPKDCGWSYVKSSAIQCNPLLQTDYERTVVISKPGEYVISGSNTTDHVKFSIEADCDITLDELTLSANKMDIIWAKGGDITGECGYYSRVYDTISISPRKKVYLSTLGKVGLSGSKSSILVGKDAYLSLECLDESTEVSLGKVWSAGTMETQPQFTGSVLVYGGVAVVRGGSVSMPLGQVSVDKSSSPKLYGQYVSTQYELQDDIWKLQYIPAKYPQGLSPTAFPRETIKELWLFGGDVDELSVGRIQKMVMYGGRASYSSLPEWAPCTIGSLEVSGGEFEGAGDLKVSEDLVLSGGRVENRGLIAGRSVRVSGGELRIVEREKKDVSRPCSLSAETVTIDGGLVDSIAGIHADDVAISAGVVWAHGGQVNNGGGIQGNVRISGGEVHARASRSGSPLHPAIGGKDFVEISGGEVWVNSVSEDDYELYGCAGIGDCDSIVISGGEVHARGLGPYSAIANRQASGAAIGDSCGYGKVKTINLLGGVITADAGTYGCAIGPGSNAHSEMQIVFAGAEVRAEGGSDCPAIYSVASNPVRILGGTVVARAWNSKVTDVTDIGCWHNDYDKGCVFVEGGSYHNMTDTGDVRNLAGYVCHRVTVEGIAALAGERALIGGLPKDYKNVRFDAEAKIYLWLTNGFYKFTVNGCSYMAEVADANTTATLVGMTDVAITVDANGGAFPDGDKVKVVTLDYGDVFELETSGIEMPTREGYTLVSWTSSRTGPSSKPYTADATFTANWKSNEELAKEAGGENAKHPKPWYLFDASPGVFPNGERYASLFYDIGDVVSLDAINTPTLAGQEFYGWWDWEKMDYLAEGDLVEYGHNLVAVYMAKSETVPFYFCIGNDLKTTADYKHAGYSEIVRNWDINTWAFSHPSWDGHRFIGWFSKPGGKGKEFKPEWDGEKYGRLTDDDVAYYAYWQLISVDWTMNRYQCADVKDLGVNLPALKFRKAVKAENLPKGLKLVEDKSTHFWYIEGVPTETRDIETNFAVVRCQFNDGTPDKVMKVMLNIRPDVHAEWKLELNSVCSVPASDLFGQPVDQGWKMSGLAANLKYAQKDNTKWVDTAKAEHYEAAFTFYGQPNKLGPMTILGKKTLKSQVPGQTASFTETYSAEVLVTPVGGAYDASYTVYANEDMALIDLTTLPAVTFDAKTTATVLPTGMKFTARDIASDKVYGSIPAGSLYGKPTKIGIYAVTVKDQYKTEAYVLIRVADPAAPEIGAYFGTKKTKLMKAISAGAAEAEQNRPITLMVGAATAFPLSVGEGATVKAGGLPAGLSIVQDRSTKIWTITGYPTKAGTYLTTLTVTRNKVSSTVSYIFQVGENEFTGEYRGCVTSYPSGDSNEPVLGLVTVNVAAGGATKITLSEHGKTTCTYSAKNFNWDDLNGNAWIAFDVPLTTAQKKIDWPTRTFTIEIVDKGHGYRMVSGMVANTEPDQTYYETGTFQAWPVVSAATLNGHGVIVDEMPTVWAFDKDDTTDAPSSAITPIAVVSTCPAAAKGLAKGDAKVQVKLRDGTLAKIAKLPILRVGQDLDDPKSYAYAPFAVTGAKSEGSITYFFRGLMANGSPEFLAGGVTASGTVSYEDWDCSCVRDYSARFAKPYANFAVAENLANVAFAESVLVFDFGHGGSEFFSVARNAKGDKLEARDSMGNLLSTWNAKIAKDTGAVSLKFTTKDRVHAYALDLVSLGNGEFTGIVIDTWKDGKVSKSASGIAEMFGTKLLD